MTRKECFRMVLGLFCISALVFLWSPVAQAQDDPCSPPTYQSAGGGFALTYLSGPDLETSGVFEGMYSWRYSLSNTDAKASLSFFYAAIPYDCYQPIEAVGPQSNAFKYYDPGVGGKSFGNGIYNDRVLEITHNSLYDDVIFYADTKTKGAMSFAISHGKDTYYADGPILGPGYLPSDIPPQRIFEVMDLGGDENGTITIKIWRNPVTGCIEKITDIFDNPFPEDTPLFDGREVDHAGTIEGNQRCSEAIVHVPGNSYYIWTGTRWIKVY